MAQKKTDSTCVMIMNSISVRFVIDRILRTLTPMRKELRESEPWSNSIPNGDEVSELNHTLLVLRACFPSKLSRV